MSDRGSWYRVWLRWEGRFTVMFSGALYTDVSVTEGAFQPSHYTVEWVISIVHDGLKSTCVVTVPQGFLKSCKWLYFEKRFCLKQENPQCISAVHRIY